MNMLKKALALTLLAAVPCASAATWTTVGGNSSLGLELNSGFGFGVGVGTLGLEAGVSVTPGQIGLLTNFNAQTANELLNNRAALDGAEARLGVVWRDIPIPVGGLKDRLNGYLGVGAAYAFNKIYGVLDDMESGNVAQDQALDFALQRLFSDLNLYAQAGLMGNLAGPVGWKAGVRYSNGLSFHVGLDLKF